MYPIFKMSIPSIPKNERSMLKRFVLYAFLTNAFLFVWNVVSYKNEVDDAVYFLYEDMKHWTYNSTSYDDHALFNVLKYCYAHSIPEVFEPEHVPDILEQSLFFTKIRKDRLILKAFELKDECLDYMQQKIEKEGEYKGIDIDTFFYFKRNLAHNLRYRT